MSASKRTAQYDPETGELLAVFPSQTAAAQSIPGEASPAKINECCRGRAKTAYGYKWGYYRHADRRGG